MNLNTKITHWLQSADLQKNSYKTISSDYYNTCVVVYFFGGKKEWSFKPQMYETVITKLSTSNTQPLKNDILLATIRMDIFFVLDYYRSCASRVYISMQEILRHSFLSFSSSNSSVSLTLFCMKQRYRICDQRRIHVGGGGHRYIATPRFFVEEKHPPPQSWKNVKRKKGGNIGKYKKKEK